MYKLPEKLGEDIARFAEAANDYQQEQTQSDAFKAIRVPMGVYEQRQDETYMSRIRTTGGIISPEQLLEVIEIARNHHSDLLHITTRQEIQIQNLRLNHIEPVLYELQRIGLATKGGGGNTIRNILVSEESGISADEWFDTTPYALALTSKLLAEADSYLLPRKMKIAFSSDDKQTEYAAINDIGLVAQIKAGKRGFTVYVGGGAGAKPTIGWVVFDFIPIEELFRVVTALKKFFYEHGDRENRNKARLRFVFYRLGEEEAIRLIHEYYAVARKHEQLFVPDDYKEGEERPEFSYQAPQDLPVDESGYVLWKKRYVTHQKQKGYNRILVPFPHGNIRLDEKTADGVQKLLRFVAQFGIHTIRFTTAQNIHLRNIPDIALPELYEILKEIVVNLHAPVLINHIASCTGADMCRLGIGLSKGLAEAIRRELLQSPLDLDKLASARIHISGCPNSCGQQLLADIGFSGKILRNDRAYPGYQVFLAANRGTTPKLAEPIGSISAKDIPVFIHRLLEAYLHAESRYATLTSYLESEGKALAIRLIAEYQTIPSFEEDKSYYYDWGAETLFGAKRN